MAEPPPHFLMEDLPHAGVSGDDVPVVAHGGGDAAESAQAQPPVPADLLGISPFVVRLLLERADPGEDALEFYRRVVLPQVYDTPYPHSLAASLPASHSACPEPLSAKATCYVVFPRAMPVHELLDALLFFAKHNPGHYFWVDMFSSSPKEAQVLTRRFLHHTLPARIDAIGTALLVEPDFDDLCALKRQWCLWELVCVADLKRPLHIVEASANRFLFSEDLRGRFLRAISRSIRVCWDEAEFTSRQHGMRFTCVHRQQTCVDQRIVQIVTPAVARYARMIARERAEPVDADIEVWIEVQLLEKPVKDICKMIRMTPQAIKVQDQAGRNLLYHSALLLRHEDRHVALRRIMRAILDTDPGAARVPIDSGWNSLYSALSSSAPLDVIDMLIEAFPESVQQPNKQGDWFPLHVAAANQAPLEVIVRLHDLFPEALKIWTSQDSTVLHFATRNGSSLEVIQFLLKMYPEAVRVENKNGWLPLHEATYRDSELEIIQALVAAYPEALSKRTNLKWLPVHVMVSDDFRLDVFDYLLHMYPKVVEERDGAGWLLLHALVSSSSPLSAVKTVYDMFPGAIKESNSDGMLALHIAVSDITSAEIVEFLIREYPDALSIELKTGRCALHLSAACLDPEIVRLVHQACPHILQKECNIGRTPLQWTCVLLSEDPFRASSNFDVFKYLWEASRSSVLRFLPATCEESAYLASQIRKETMLALGVTLCEHTAAPVIDALKDCRSLEHLCISRGSALPTSGWSRLLADISSLPKLRVLSLKDDNLHDVVGMASIVAAFLKRSKIVRSLELPHAELPFDAELRQAILRHPTLISVGMGPQYAHELRLLKDNRARLPWSVAAHTGVATIAPEPSFTATKNVFFVLTCLAQTDFWLPPELRTYILEFLRLDEVEALAIGELMIERSFFRDLAFDLWVGNV